MNTCPSIYLHLDLTLNLTHSVLKYFFNVKWNKSFFCVSMRNDKGTLLPFGCSLGKLVRKKPQKHCKSGDAEFSNRKNLTEIFDYDVAISLKKCLVTTLAYG